MSSLPVFAILVVSALAALARPYIGVLAWVWFSLENPHRLVYGPGADLPYGLIIATLTFIGWVMSSERKVPRDGTSLLCIAFMTWITITTIFALAPEAWTKWDSTIKMLLFVLLIILLARDRVRVHALVWTIVIALGLFGLKGGLFSLASGGTSRVWGPPDSMITDNNHLGLALLFSVPLQNYLRTMSDNRLLRLGLGGLMGLTLLATVCTYSRGAALGLAGMLGFLWLRSQRKWALTGVFVLLGIAAGMFLPQQWYDRVNTIETYDEDHSATDRLDMWKTATVLAIQRPLFAGGFLGPYTRSVVDQFDPMLRARAVHSIYFEVIGEHGFIGFAIWLAVPLVAWRNAGWIARRARDRPDLRWAVEFARMAQISLSGYLISGTFLSLSYWDGYWSLVALIAATRGIVAAKLAPAVQPRAMLGVSFPQPIKGAVA